MAPTNALPWPDHWCNNHNQDELRCIVPHCQFVSNTRFRQEQFSHLYAHCLETQGAEHGILGTMLQQTMCAINDCDHYMASGHRSSGLRALFAHENSVHGSQDMFNICSFVRLAREGRIRRGMARKPVEECERLAFERMLDKVMALPRAEKDSLIQRSGYHHPHEQSRPTMGKILTADPLAQDWENPPYWWPVRADYFLKLIRPDPNNPADDQWKITWTRLREEYADGRI